MIANYYNFSIMCYAIPGKIVEINSRFAVVDYFGEKRNVLNDEQPIKIGDYVYAQGGILVDKVETKEAIKILEFWKRQFFELKKIDRNLSQKAGKQKIEQNTLSLFQKINRSQELSNQEALTLLSLSNRKELELLYKMANNIRQKNNDNACCVHGIIEFSNCCANNCFYCGIRKNLKISRFRMSPEEIINTAQIAVEKYGFKALVLQSGEDPYYTEKILELIIKKIRAMGVLIFLSIGVRDASEYESFYKAGARAILLRFETSNKKIFKRLRPNTSFEKRIKLIKKLKKIGYLIATGFLIGLPDETNQDIINNIILTKKLEADMYSFGPLIPAGGTPLGRQKTADIDLVLKTIALTRIIDHEAKILVTTALETLGTNAKKRGLLAGANSLMLNVTPSIFRKKYAIYPGRPDRNKGIEKNIKSTVNLLYSIGRAPTDLGI